MGNKLSRDYSRFDSYLTAISQDVYAQPTDKGHTAWATHAVETMLGIVQNVKTVLDVGCGQGFLQPVFAGFGIEWTGLTIGEDYSICKRRGLNVVGCDMTFTNFKDKEFDLLFARHVLEHSPFPLITLMEWRRICSGWMMLVAPSPAYWGVRGRNHYSVIYYEHLEWLLKRAGWNPVASFTLKTGDALFKEHLTYPETEPEKIVEYRVLCERIKPEVE